MKRKKEKNMPWQDSSLGFVRVKPIHLFILNRLGDSLLIALQRAIKIFECFLITH